METEALICMLLVQVGVTATTIYFFTKVLKAEKKNEDSGT